MILSKLGESMTWDGTTFTVGDQVYATDTSEYRGLIGTITEIRDGEDKETENYLPDIYCCFQVPVFSYDRAELEKRFSELYRCPKKLDEIALDMVIMGPDMLIPMKVLDTQHDTITVYHIYEEWTVNGEQGSSVSVTTDYDDAKRRFARMFTEEMTDGIISANQGKSGFTVEEKKDYYSCWIDGDYLDFHYKLRIQEEEAVLTNRIAAKIGRKNSDRILRQEFYQQISNWQEVSDLTDEELNQLVLLPELPEILRKALDSHPRYWECYRDAISDKAYHLVQNFRREMGKTELQ